VKRARFACAIGAPTAKTAGATAKHRRQDRRRYRSQGTGDKIAGVTG